MVKNNKKVGFSLMEVLLSVLILSVILVLAFPIVSKKLIGPNKTTKNGSAFFYYKESNGENFADFPCYITTEDDDGSRWRIARNQSGCNYYEFVVPNNVYKVDMTLVAGGGGGGGASGGVIYKKTIESGSENNSFKIDAEHLAGVTLDFLTSKGEDGESGSAGFVDNTEVRVGNGGKSGNAIVNFKIPKNFLEIGKAFRIPVSRLSYDFSVGDYNFYFTENSDGITFNIGKEIIVQNGKEVETTSFFVAKTPFESKTVHGETKKFYSTCSITDKNGETKEVDYCFEDLEAYTKEGVLGNQKDVEERKLIRSGFNEGNKERVSSGYIFYGNEGGKISGVSEKYGMGGRGYSAQLFSIAGSSNARNVINRKANANIETIDNEKGKPAGGKATISVYYPGKPGNGGTGGTAVKLKDFPVEPGHRYIIAVGKGGAGGEKGTTGITDQNLSSGGETPGTTGGDGFSSAIYDAENGALVMMVTGGKGGTEGYSEGVPEIYSIKTYDNKNRFSKMRSLFPLVVSDNLNVVGGYIDRSSLQDSPLTSAVSESTLKTTLDRININHVERLFPSFEYMPGGGKVKNNNPSPISLLRTNVTGIASDADLTRLRSQARTSGYSLNGIIYRTANTTADPIKCIGETNGTFRGLNRVAACIGLESRNVIDNEYLYAGGNGGFSLLDSKAGCGGYFLGNNDGYETYGTLVRQEDGFTHIETAGARENPLLRNTMVLNKRIYDINDYYSGCSAKTPDGHAAEFVAPQITKGGVSYGAAGSGGGGGGYSLEQGPGKGGDGQNGYVFINWKTE